MTEPQSTDVDALRDALKRIADYEPERVGPSEELLAEQRACAECAECRRREWPPSRLCNGHYTRWSREVWGRNDHAERTQHIDLKRIARDALRELRA